MKSIEDAGLLDVILYTDICNEWPRAPFFKEAHPEVLDYQWEVAASQEWMRRSIEKIEAVYPDMPLTYSFDASDLSKYDNAKADYLDLYEHHVWMMKQNKSEFRKAVGYGYEKFSPAGYKNLVNNTVPVYRAKPEYWNDLLTTSIQTLAEKSAETGKPLITTECWAIVDYKDWSLLQWDWVKDLCELGVETSAATGQWVAIATSTFCAPQFVGMWRDIELFR